MRACSLFALTALICLAGAFLWLEGQTEWDLYAVWMTAASAVTFGFYGSDKLLSKLPGPDGLRIPECILHILAAVGGVWGAWLGMFLLPHKIDWEEHRAFPPILFASTLFHLGLAYFWLLR